MYYNKCNLSKFEKELLIMTLDSMEELTKVTRGYNEMEPVAKKISKLTKEEEMQGIYIKEEQEEFIRQKIREYAAAKGYEEGIEKGRKEGTLNGALKKQKELVEKMLSEKLDLLLIKKITGLSIDELKKLKKQD